MGEYLSLFGTVDWQGYTIWGRVPSPSGPDIRLRVRGNYHYASKQVLHYKNPYRQSADTLREYCRMHGEEVATELGLEFTDVSDSGGWAW